MSFADWIGKLLGRRPKPNSRVAFYDAAARRVIHMPAEELAPGAVLTSQVGIDEPVWVLAGQLQPGPLQHPPFDQEIREYVQRIQEAFAEHRPLTLDEWEDGFRRDCNANQEIALWRHAANVYLHFASSEALGDRRKHIYQVIVACLTASPETVRRVLPPGSLSSEEIDRVVRRFFPGSKANTD